jgi:hypothetical protein
VHDQVAGNCQEKGDGEGEGVAAAAERCPNGDDDGGGEKNRGEKEPERAGGSYSAGKGTDGEEQRSLAQDGEQISVSP